MGPITRFEEIGSDIAFKLLITEPLLLKLTRTWRAISALFGDEIRDRLVGLFRLFIRLFLNSAIYTKVGKRMKTLQTRNIGKKQQAGFTIIELVVVILLLGILTATALPRFMDISDEAHQAVVDATLGSLRTGLALYHAQWLAEGQPGPATAVSYDGSNLFPEAAGNGYPSSSDGTQSSEADCGAVLSGLITFGGLGTANAAFSAVAATLEGNIETAATSTTDWVSVPSAAAAPFSCVYYYTGQYKSGNVAGPNTIQTLTYAVTTGAVTTGTYTMNNN